MLIFFAVFFSIIFVIISLILAYLLFSILSLFIIRVPYVNTPPEYMMKVIAEIDIPKHSVIADLGCGNGRFLIEALKRFSPKKCVGYEIAPTAYLAAAKNTFFKKGIFIKYENFFKADFSEFDLIYIYLLPKLVDKLTFKLKKEIKPGCKIVTIGSRLS